MHAPLSPEKRLLLKAADLLREKGHCKNIIEHQGRHCAVGAILASTSEHELHDAALDLLAKYIGVDHRGDIPAWNNAPQRTADEVIEAFERAALT